MASCHATRFARADIPGDVGDVSKKVPGSHAELCCAVLARIKMKMC